MRSMKRGRLGLTVMALVTALVVQGAPIASAGDDDVIRRGSCSGASNWKLKLSHEDGGIEVEYEVDQNVNGDTWRVVMKHDGVRFFRGRRTTKAPSGSFEVRRVTNNKAGTDSYLAKAVNLDTSETCRGRASI